MLTLRHMPQRTEEKGERHTTERFEADNPDEDWDVETGSDPNYPIEADLADLARIEGFWEDEDGSWISEDEYRNDWL